MKESKNNDNIALIFTIILIAIIILVVLYSVFSSKNLLKINTSNNDNTNTNTTTPSQNSTPNGSNSNNSNNTNNSNSGTSNNSNVTVSEEEKDRLNVDVQNSNTTNTKPPVPEQTETEIAAYTTTIYDKDQNRVDNITLAISKINGKVIEKGSEFSFNGTVGPMGEAQGFKKAVGFDGNGKKIQIPGGGMCQISSTLYNTALIAGLEVTERHPHSRRVYYVPKDKDATILYDSLDLKFINNTDGSIKIYASNDAQNVTVRLVKITNSQ